MNSEESFARFFASVFLIFCFCASLFHFFGLALRIDPRIDGSPFFASVFFFLFVSVAIVWPRLTHRSENRREYRVDSEREPEARDGAAERRHVVDEPFGRRRCRRRVVERLKK